MPATNRASVQYKGADFRGLPLLVSNTGSSPSRAVALSELTQLTAAQSALEAAYLSADAAQDAALATTLSTLNTQISGLQQGINKKAAVKVRFVGLLSALQSAGGTVDSIAMTAMADASEPDTALEMLASSVLLDSTDPLESGIYYYSSGSTFVRHTAFDAPAELPASSLIYVDSGTYQNTFWLMADSPTSTAINIIPFGQATSVDVAPTTFLTRTANELNTSLNDTYFTVTSGSLTFSSAFLNRFVDIEAEVAAIQVDITALETSVATLQTSVASKTTLAAVQGLFSSAIKAVTLTAGVYDSVEATTTFYANSGTSAYKFSFLALNAVATPYALQSIPTVTREANPTGNVSALKIVFDFPTQIADGDYEVVIAVTDVNTIV